MSLPVLDYQTPSVRSRSRSPVSSWLEKCFLVVFGVVLPVVCFVIAAQALRKLRRYWLGVVPVSRRNISHSRGVLDIRCEGDLGDRDVGVGQKALGVFDAHPADLVKHGPAYVLAERRLQCMAAHGHPAENIGDTQRAGGLIADDAQGSGHILIFYGEGVAGPSHHHTAGGNQQQGCGIQPLVCRGEGLRHQPGGLGANLPPGDGHAGKRRKRGFTGQRVVIDADHGNIFGNPDAPAIELKIKGASPAIGPGEDGDGMRQRLNPVADVGFEKRILTGKPGLTVLIPAAMKRAPCSRTRSLKAPMRLEEKLLGPTKGGKIMLTLGEKIIGGEMPDGNIVHTDRRDGETGQVRLGTDDGGLDIHMPVQKLFWGDCSQQHTAEIGILPLIEQLVLIDGHN